MNDTTTFPKPVNGINNVSPETNLPEGSLVSAINVDLDKEGNVRSRKGYTPLYSGSKIHSLFERYFVEGTDLKQLDSFDLPVTITTNLKPDNFLAWVTINGEVIYSDGTPPKILPDILYGVPTPAGQPELSETSGGLDAGTYQVAIVYQDHSTGQISGTKLASVISVGNNSGITLSNIPQFDGYNIVVYCSTQNGEALYQNIILPGGTTSHIIYNSRKHTRTLDTQFMEPLPGGHILRHFNGRLYCARDNVLWYSRAMRYGLHKPEEDFYQFAAKITVVQPVTDGLYVVADKTYFIQGNEPKTATLIVVSDDTGIEGTGISTDGSAFGLEASVMVAYWFSNKGAVLSLPNGKLQQLTEDRLALNAMRHGVSMLKEQNGIRQIITNMSDTGMSNGFGFGAQATGTIIRNGVIIN